MTIQKQNRSDILADPVSQRYKIAVFRALCTVLNEEDAKTAAENWVQNYGKGGSVFNGLNLYVRTTCQTYDKVGSQRELIQEISRALLSRDAAHVPRANPEPILTRMDADMMSVSSLSGSEIKTVEFAGFQVLLLSLLAELKLNDVALEKACRKFLLDVVQNLPWSETQQNQVVTLIDTGSAIQTRSYRSGQLKNLIQYLTAWISENLGQSVATKIVERALINASSTKAGQACHPGEFI